MKRRVILLPAIFSLLFLHSRLPAQTYNWAFGVGSTGMDGMGGTGDGTDIQVDGNGDVIMVGTFTGTNVDFEPGGGTVNLSSAGGNEIFISKYNSAGALVWAFSLGSTGSDYAYKVDVDVDNNIYVTGAFSNTVDFDPGAGTNSLVASATDVFVAKYNSLGLHQWAFKLGGTGSEFAYGLDVDAGGNVVVTGLLASASVDFNPAGGACACVSGESIGDMFVAKYTGAGAYLWAFAVGAAGYQDMPIDLTTDSNNDIYITGWFSMTVDFQPGGGTMNVSAVGGTETFVVKYSNAGVAQWAFGLGSTGSGENGRAIMTDASNNVYVGGSFDQTVDFDPGAGVYTMTNGSLNTDIFWAKYTSAGALVWAKQTVAVGFPKGFATDGTYLYVTGYFDGSNRDFDPNAGTALMSASGTWYDIYVAKYDFTNSDYQWAFRVGHGSVSDYGHGIAVDGCTIYVTGAFQGNTADFDPGAGSAVLTSIGSYDIFLASYSCDAGALPVMLTDFHASPRSDAVELSWVTEHEYENGYFVVERSSDGLRYERTGEVQGTAGATAGHAYSMTDVKPNRGMNYYRLLQYDEDGGMNIHGPVSCNFTGDDDFDLKASWSGDQLAIFTNCPGDGEMKFSLYNSTGAWVGSQVFDAESGINTFIWDLPSPAQGIYILTCSPINSPGLNPKAIRLVR